MRNKKISQKRICVLILVFSTLLMLTACCNEVTMTQDGRFWKNSNYITIDEDYKLKDYSQETDGNTLTITIIYEKGDK